MMMKCRSVSRTLWAAAMLVGVCANAASPPQARTVVRQSEAPPAPPTLDPLVPFQDRLARARANYEALSRGDLAVRDLSPQDLQDILELDRALRGGLADNRTASETCIDIEVERAGGQPSRLAWKVIELKCREIGSELPR